MSVRRRIGWPDVDVDRPRAETSREGGFDQLEVKPEMIENQHRRSANRLLGIRRAQGAMKCSRKCGTSRSTASNRSRKWWPDSEMEAPPVVKLVKGESIGQERKDQLDLVCTTLSWVRLISLLFSSMLIARWTSLGDEKQGGRRTGRRAKTAD